MTPNAILTSQAIQAAKDQDWQRAVELNENIIAEQSEDVQAYMRLGVAKAQLDDVKAAKTAFEHVLELDKANTLAKKHLQKLANKQQITVSVLPKDEEFIEEPGKTKTIELHRLAGKEQLEKIIVGQACELRSKNRFISVEAGKTYIGSLPEDLSARLTKLMKSGNTYACYVQAVSPTSCSVFIKEIHRSPENEFTHSFPPTKNQLTMNEMYLSDDSLPLQIENVPIQMFKTEEDEEKTLDSFDPTEEPEEAMPDEPDEPTRDSE